MTIGSIIFIVIGGIILIGGIGLTIWAFTENDPGFGIVIFVISLILAAVCIVSPIIYMQTESGQRALKDQKSNFGDGIERTVTVYDINGQVIEQYSGKFDVETTSEYIIFDDENDFEGHYKAEMLRYYSNIVGKYSNMVQKAWKQERQHCKVRLQWKRLLQMV